MNIEGWEEQQIEEALVEKVLSRINTGAKVDKQIAELVSGAAEERVEKIADEEIRAAVVAKIAEGFQPTNSFGEARGQPVTLKARIGEMLTQNVGGYNDKTTRVEKLTKDVIEHVLRAEFAKEIEAARAAFRKALDEELTVKIRDTMRLALGITR